MNKGLFTHLVILFLYILVVMWITDGIDLSAEQKSLIVIFGLFTQVPTAMIWLNEDWACSPLIKKQPSKK